MSGAPHRRVAAVAASAALAVTLGSCGSSSPSPAGSATPVTTPSPTPTQHCPPRFHDVHGISVRTFCGSARVSARARGHRIHGSGGRCKIGPTYVVVNVGSIVLGRGQAARRLRAKHFYFVASVGRLPGDRRHAPARRDGRYNLRLLALVDHGRTYVAQRGRVLLTTSRTRGRFAAALTHGGRITGAWIC